MRVKVEQRHIDNGGRCNSSNCPIALAVKEDLHKEFGVSVGVEELDVYVNHGFFVWQLPPEAMKFILDFDGGYSVEPFEFEAKCKYTTSWEQD